jgi:microsomal dipeptidase-like Zn-dependent dipeptidase
LEDVTRLPALTAGLATRGYDEASVHKILGLNLLRVFRQVAG